MNRIALIAFILGILMATLGYVAELNEWSRSAEFMTVGFAGYVLVISAAAYYLTTILYEWSKETEAWHG
jgi:vacuolar-type H+-ATPase subunit I/STV1